MILYWSTVRLLAARHHRGPAAKRCILSLAQQPRRLMAVDACAQHEKTPTVLLTERIAQLGLCSKSKAERYLKESHKYITSTGVDKNRSEVPHTNNNPNVIYLNGRAIIGGDHTPTQVPSNESDIEIQKGLPIRLSKRMSELSICSKREAARILTKTNEVATEGTSLHSLDNIIYLRGQPVTDGAAVKVSPTERYIEIRAGNDRPNEQVEDAPFKEFVPYGQRQWEEIMGDTIILNKPVGYVSGQEEHQHVPAVRLLTQENMHLDNFNAKTQQLFRTDHNIFNFVKWRFDSYDDMRASTIPKHIRDTLRREHNPKDKGKVNIKTLSGYAPAGRLDIDSTGLLVFTKAGIMARRLIEPKSKISKEYIVKVQPAFRLSANEKELGIQSLPRPTDDLRKLTKRGNWLAGMHKPLKPLLSAEWLHNDNDETAEANGSRTMRLVLVEGKKRQIRRMIRELLGWHVVELERISIGSVHIGTLPKGKWRPLTEDEVKAIFRDGPRNKERVMHNN